MKCQRNKKNIMFIITMERQIGQYSNIRFLILKIWFPILIIRFLFLIIQLSILIIWFLFLIIWFLRLICWFLIFNYSISVFHCQFVQCWGCDYRIASSATPYLGSMDHMCLPMYKGKCGSKEQVHRAMDSINYLSSLPCPTSTSLDSTNHRPYNIIFKNHAR